MSNNKQSSVEWLIEQVKSKEWQDKFIWHKEDVFQQAKAMHKEEICQFVSDYLDDAADNMVAEEYYDQIYGGKNE
jgi:hypothetical protein